MCDTKNHTNTIKNYEKRVKLNKVEVNANLDSNEFDVLINYYIVGVDIPAQELNFVLEPTR